MKRIFLTTKPLSFPIDKVMSTDPYDWRHDYDLVIYAPEYLRMEGCWTPDAIPSLTTYQGRRAVSFTEFRKDPTRHLEGIKRLLVLGLTWIMTPSNRNDYVWEVLFNLRPAIEKFVMDRCLFIGDPWRLWFPFGLTGVPYAEYTYSYLAESHYNAWVEGIRPENPFSVKEVVRWGKGNVLAVDPFRFRSVSVQSLSTSEEIREAYAIEKEKAFAEEKTAKAIIRRLERFAQQQVPNRLVPARGKIFETEHLVIRRTDLPVDQYVVKDLLHNVVRIINQSAEWLR